jgi:RimJ/RimL family protein N-acetyltransferase
MGFTDLGVQRVYGHTMTANMASRHVLEKCGLTLVHTTDGAEHGEVEYALTKPEWEAMLP